MSKKEVASNIFDMIVEIAISTLVQIELYF